MLLPLGFLGTFLLNNFLKETYSSRKLELEKSIENLLDKNVDLGDYVGIRFLGISLGNSKINDKKNIDSEIKAKNVYVGIMPFRSFLKQKWIVKIRPEQSEISIERDFFKREKPYEKVSSKNKSKLKYELNFDFKNYSILNLKKSLSILIAACSGLIFTIHFCFKKDPKGIMPTYTFLALISEFIFFLSLIFELAKDMPRNLIPT